MRKILNLIATIFAFIWAKLFSKDPGYDVNDVFKQHTVQVKASKLGLAARNLLFAVLEFTEESFHDYDKSRITLTKLLKRMAKPTDQELARVEEVSVDGEAGEIPVYIMHPEGQAKGILLQIHGGGWAIGGGEAVKWAMMRWKHQANELGLILVAPDYRLAPEDIYPAGPDDCEAVALYARDVLLPKYNLTDCFVTGESAGSHLACVTTLRMRQRHDYKFKAAFYVYGMFDFHSWPASRYNYGSKMQSATSCQNFYDVFTPDPAIRADPDISVVNADLNDMPPAMFICGGQDQFMDDNRMMANKWAEAGNTANLVIYSDAAHGFDALPIPERDHFHKLTVAFFKQYL